MPTYDDYLLHRALSANGLSPNTDVDSGELDADIHDIDLGDNFDRGVDRLSPYLLPRGANKTQEPTYDFLPYLVPNGHNNPLGPDSDPRKRRFMVYFPPADGLITDI